ncbi:hypothetical protein D3C74_233890 [compost metagenome]
MDAHIENVYFNEVDEEITKIVGDQLVIKGDLFLSVEVTVTGYSEYDQPYTVGTAVSQLVSG